MELQCKFVFTMTATCLQTFTGLILMEFFRKKKQ